MEDSLTKENTTKDSVTVAAAAEEQPTYANAMAENWAKKGANSYYYAHKNTNIGAGAENSYGGGPKLIHSQPKQSVQSEKKAKLISGYSWADGKKTVKVYIEIEGLDDVAEDKIEINTTSTSFSLTIHMPDTDYTLQLQELYDEIKDCVVKKKNGNRLVLVLSKVKEFTWYELKKN